MRFLLTYDPGKMPPDVAGRIMRDLGIGCGVLLGGLAVLVLAIGYAY